VRSAKSLGPISEALAEAALAVNKSSCRAPYCFVAVRVPDDRGDPVPNAIVDPHDRMKFPENPVHDADMAVGDEKVQLNVEVTFYTSRGAESVPEKLEPAIDIGRLFTMGPAQKNVPPSRRTVTRIICTAPSATHAVTGRALLVVPVHMPSYCPLPDRADCVIVNDRPAIVMVPVRDAVPVFGSTPNEPKLVVPEVPERTSTGVIHGTSAAMSNAHPEGLSTLYPSFPPHHVNVRGV